MTYTYRPWTRATDCLKHLAVTHRESPTLALKVCVHCGATWEKTLTDGVWVTRFLGAMVAGKYAPHSSGSSAAASST